MEWNDLGDPIRIRMTRDLVSVAAEADRYPRARRIVAMVPNEA